METSRAVNAWAGEVHGNQADAVLRSLAQIVIGVLQRVELYDMSSNCGENWTYCRDTLGKTRDAFAFHPTTAKESYIRHTSIQRYRGTHVLLILLNGSTLAHPSRACKSISASTISETQPLSSSACPKYAKSSVYLELSQACSPANEVTQLQLARVERL